MQFKPGDDLGRNYRFELYLCPNHMPAAFWCQARNTAATVTRVAAAVGWFGSSAGWPSQCLEGYGSTRQNDSGLTALRSPPATRREPAATFCGTLCGVGAYVHRGRRRGYLRL